MKGSVDDDDDSSAAPRGAVSRRAAVSPKPGSVLSLLSTREIRGVVVGLQRPYCSSSSASASSDLYGGRGRSHRVPYRTERDVTVNDLSSAAAWNVRRMQNMILAVGPGTPASAVIGPLAPSSSSSDSDNDDDDDDEELESEEEQRHEVELLDTDEGEGEGEEDGGDRDGDDVVMGEGSGDDDNEEEKSGEEEEGAEEEEEEEEEEGEEQDDGGREARRGERRRRWARRTAAAARTREEEAQEERQERRRQHQQQQAQRREELFGGEQSRLRRREMVEETVRAIAAALREGGATAAAAEVLAAGSAALREQEEEEEEEEHRRDSGSGDDDDGGRSGDENETSDDGSDGSSDVGGEEDGDEDTSAAGEGGSSGEEEEKADDDEAEEGGEEADGAPPEDDESELCKMECSNDGPAEDDVESTGCIEEQDMETSEAEAKKQEVERGGSGETTLPERAVGGGAAAAAAATTRKEGEEGTEESKKHPVAAAAAVAPPTASASASESQSSSSGRRRTRASSENTDGDGGTTAENAPAPLPPNPPPSAATARARAPRAVPTHGRAGRVMVRLVYDGAPRRDDSVEDQDDDEQDRRRTMAGGRRSANGRSGRRRIVRPSMRHGGCINTASWLACPWRLSLTSAASGGSGDAFMHSSSHSSNNASSYMSSASNGDSRDNEERDDDIPLIPSAVSTYECPTQLITSGDDRLVKFWDVSGAMGSTSPSTGGAAALTPFSSSSSSFAAASSTGEPSQDVVRGWKGRYRNGYDLPGTVVPLATLQTGHRGNVFHATAVPSRPGKVLTCAADGFLRMPDVEVQSVPGPGATSVGHSHGGSGSSSSVPPAAVIISPEYDNEDDDDDNAALLPPGLLSLRSGMCFSHHMLDADTGLLCSERGLRRFDLRVGPREQSRRRSALGGPGRTCKSCAVWSASGSSVGGNGGGNDGAGGGLDSAYVFAGGSSGDVALYDLRMADGHGSSSRIVQHYRPRAFGPNESVSVSGIDVSRDKRELLVSYENDQIYTFPIFPHASSPAGPTVEEMASYGTAVPDGDDEDEEEEDGGGDTVLALTVDHRSGEAAGGRRPRAKKRQLMRELATYGGHLNRYTFLKMAKYAGPNDEYICTGSDSGHAWIYDRRTGGVSSLLSADHSTCNGVVPHPTLPVFVTYGIDSTAKLWRATVPVDDEVDDSDRGRARSAHTAPYVKSPVVRSWKTVSAKLDALSDFDEENEQGAGIEGEDGGVASPSGGLCLLPDEVPARDDDLDDAVFGGLAGVLFRSARLGGGAHGSAGGGGGPPFVGNDLRNLPHVLRQNYYACVRSGRTGEDPPVRSGLVGFKRRVGLLRTGHQADRLGLARDDPEVPWVFRPKRIGGGGSKYEKKDGAGTDKDDDDANAAAEYGHPSDLVPEHPSDWMPFDPDMASGKPLESGMLFNSDYLDYLSEQYGPRTGGAKSSTQHIDKHSNEAEDVFEGDTEASGYGTEHQVKDESMQEAGSDEQGDVDIEVGKESGGESERVAEPSAKSAGRKPAQNRSSRSWDILHETVQTLKEGGNMALRASNAPLAARRYDCALQYCSVAFMDFPEGNLDFLCAHQVQILQNGGHTVRWTPLLKLMITIRLNLSMTLLRPEIGDSRGACDQAHLALSELKPFVAASGKVMTGKKLDRAREGESPATYVEAKRLQAKAYFRLGSAQHASGDFGAAARSLQRSVEARGEADPGSKPDALVTRRLAEARREYRKKRSRQRKKFKFMFQEEGSEEKQGVEEAEKDEEAVNEGDENK